MDDPVRIPTVELTRDNLETQPAVEMLGAIAAGGLKEYGQATFVMRPDGGVAYANPAHVHIHPAAVPDIEDKPFRTVRPVIGTGRPEFVVWKNGILWEIEFLDDEFSKNPGGSDR